MEKPFCKLVETEAELDACFEIRTKVFVEEQQVPAEMEIDEFEKESKHFLVSVAGKAVTTGRLRIYQSFVKFERIATLKEVRGSGTGRVLMDSMMEYAMKHYSNYLPLMNAQTSAIGFYQRLGWIEFGEEFEEAGIPHKTMVFIPKSTEQLLVWNDSKVEQGLKDFLKKHCL